MEGREEAGLKAGRLQSRSEREEKEVTQLQREVLATEGRVRSVWEGEQIQVIN